MVHIAEEADPPQQGLKRRFGHLFRPLADLAEEADPPQQGLKR